MSDRTCRKPHTAVRKVTNYLRDFLTDPAAFRGQQLRGGGPVAEFEQLLAERCGFTHCVATCNATAALTALGIAWKVRGRNVYVPRGHWEGSVAVLRVLGAKIRWYEAGRAIASGGACFRNAAMIVVGANGLPEACSSIADRATCLIVEDSSRLPGVSVPLGEFSGADAQVISFGPAKPMSLGEGGAVLMQSDALWRKLIAVSQHPERVSATFGVRAEIPEFCLNARIHPLAALLGSQLLQAFAPATAQDSSDYSRSRCATAV